MNLDLSYAAGLFEGEGSAGVYKVNRKTYRGREESGHWLWLPVVQMKMCDPEPIDFMHSLFGGYKCSWHNKWDTLSPNPKRVFDWKVSHRRALAVAQDLVLLMKSKRREDQLMKIINHYNKDPDFIIGTRPRAVTEFGPKPQREVKPSHGAGTISRLEIREAIRSLGLDPK